MGKQGSLIHAVKKEGSLIHGVRKRGCLQLGKPQDRLPAAQSRLQIPGAAPCCWGLKDRVSLGMGGMRKQGRRLEDVSFKMRRRALKTLGPCCKNKIKCSYVMPNPSKAKQGTTL